MGIEIQILDWIQGMRGAFGDFFWPLVTRLGDGGIFWIALTAIFLLIPQKRRTGAIMAASLLIDLLLCNCFLKPIVARTRPFDVNESVALLVARPTDYSFPSGHTAASFTSVCALWRAGERRWWPPMLILAVLIAFSRLYLYVHYPTDVLGGIAVGIFAGCLGAWLIGRFEAWRRGKAAKG